jgi:ATP-dependent Lon protease
MPVMALRGMNVFPGTMVHFDVGRTKSMRALDEAMGGKQEIFLVSQTDIMINDPTWEQLNKIGTVAEVRQVLKLPGDTVRVLVEGKHRGTITAMIQSDPYLLGRVETLDDKPYDEKDPKVEALIRQTYSLYEQYTELSSKQAPENFLQVLASTDPSFIADFITQHMTLRSGDNQKIMDELDPVARLELVNQNLATETEILQIENDLNDKVQENMNQNQRDYYLREQIKVIRSELGEYDEDEELDEYEDKIRKLKLPEEVEEKLLKEVSRLAKQPAGSSEAAVLRNYLDVCLELPWNTRTKETVDIEKCRKMLDADHYGLDKVKERILEILAVKKLAPNLNGQIICLVGPPGVGKTSIAMSIAKALNRKLARVALGGIHDEADIRGHRKTYIGAMPGRIISAISQAGSRNPLLLLDEIDKLGSDYRGDPSSALLEALDGEQNNSFRDHYLEVPFDLSECMFITTANTTSTIPAPLLDRMEVIELSSYTDEEKLRIAKDHLLPKQIPSTA